MPVRHQERTEAAPASLQAKVAPQLETDNALSRKCTKQSSGQSGDEREKQERDRTRGRRRGSIDRADTGQDAQPLAQAMQHRRKQSTAVNETVDALAIGGAQRRAAEEPTMVERTTVPTRKPGSLAVKLALSIIITSAAFSPAAAQTNRIRAGVDATLNSESFGYQLTCVINGHDVGFKGGGQDVIRFVRETRYLHPGRNTVAISYTKKSEGHLGEGVNIQFTVPGFPAPLFYAHVDNAASGRLQGAFDITAAPAKDFKPLYPSDYPDGAAGFIYLDQDASATGDFSLTVDGDNSGATYQGRLRYAVPLPRLHPGANHVAVAYDTHGGPLRLFVVGPKASSAITLASEQKATRTFSIMGFAP